MDRVSRSSRSGCWVVVDIAARFPEMCGAATSQPEREAASITPRGDPDYSRRRSEAQRESSWRDDSWSLRSTLDMWVSTVLMEMNSSFATSL